MRNNSIVKKTPTTKVSIQRSTAALHSRVRSILEAARDSVSRTVNSAQVMANWLIGREIIDQEQLGKGRAGYGDELLVNLATVLQVEYGAGYGVDNLELFRRFYLAYPDLLPMNPEPANSDAVRRKSVKQRGVHPISDAVRRKSDVALLSRSRQQVASNSWQPGLLSTQLSWTHYRRLLRIERLQERSFYEIEAVNNAWSARELERQVASLLFDRLAKSRDKKAVMRLATQGQEIAQMIDTLKDPMVLEFLDLPVSHRLAESDLETALINNLQSFLLELGKGFAFVSRQERITLDGDHFYVDLVFYHVVLKCYVLIDLKVGKLTHADLGQVQFYANYFDQTRISPGDNPTVGLILCSDKNDAVVKYTLGEQQGRKVFASRYQLHLPTVEELQNEIKRELRFLTPNHKNKPASKTVASKRPTRKIATPSKKRSPLAKGKP
jgi:predicted nuclease of restriction endonuclease-like (RecB) superfamily